MKAIRFLFALLGIFLCAFSTAFAAPPSESLATLPILATYSPTWFAVAIVGVIALVLALMHWQAVLRRCNSICRDYFALVLIGFFVATAFAAPRVERFFTSLIITPDIQADEQGGTNGVLRLYSANRTNWMMLGTNGEIIFGGLFGTLTGWNGAIMATNAGGISQSNTVYNGLIVRTNGFVPIAPR